MKIRQRDHHLALLVYYFFQGVAHGLRWFGIARAKLLRRGFHCLALAGQSNYNIAINADMTVSCNCQDRNGTGKIGDFNTQTMPEIFGGVTANKFRSQLAHGVLPTNWCTHCFDLRSMKRSDAIKLKETWILPKHIMVENTSVCNLACISCSRVIYDRLRHKKWLTLRDFERIAFMFKEIGVRSSTFIKLGEPFLSKNVSKEVGLLMEHNPDLNITCSTSGLAMNTPEKMEGALKMKLICFSIDGVSTEQCCKYQKGQDFDKAFRAMADLVALRNSRGQTFPVIAWKYVVFRWNDSHADIHRAYALCKEHRIDYLLLSPTISPPGAWSWRYRSNPPLKTQRRWESDMGGYVVPAAATAVHDHYLKTI